MSTRAEDMAVIESALADLQEQEQDEGDALDTGAPPTIDELVEQEQQREKEEQQKPEEPESVADATRLTQSAGQAVGVASNWATSVWTGTKNILERARTPGGLFLPIALLVLFFFVLIPVNGYSRIVWLWLVLTGNAQLSGDAQAIATREQDIILLQEQTLGQLNIQGAGASFPGASSPGAPSPGAGASFPGASSPGAPPSSTPTPTPTPRNSVPPAGYQYIGGGPYSIGSDEV